MNNFPFKKVATGLLVLLVLASVYYFFRSNQKDEPIANGINPAFAEYISSYTAGVISSGSSIRLILSGDVIDSTLVGSEITAKIFSFTPGIKGKTRWLDRRTVEFRPESKLPSGTVYQAKFFLSKLRDVPEALSTFQYSFQVIPQNFDLAVHNVKPYEKSDLRRQKIEGIVSTADGIDSDVMEKIFTSKQEGKTLAVTWIHTDEGKQHHFTIEDVARRNEPSSVRINVEGKTLGVDNDAEQDIEIPSLTDFKLIQAKAIQSPTQQIVLQFSDPLKENQNLTGLITVEGTDGLDFDIQDNLIVVYPPSKLTGEKKVRLETGIRNILDTRMKEPTLAAVLFEQLAPAVRFTGKGSILPSTNGLVLPFEAVNLNTVDITIFKIYERNMLQFLQVNEVDGNQELYRVGSKVVKKVLPLTTTGVVDFGKWNRYTLNLAEIIQPEPGAIYQVKLTFKKSYSVYACADDVSGEDQAENFEIHDDEYGNPSGYYDGYYEDDYYYYEGYDWQQRDNPCHVSYYTNNRFIKKNILASDLGLTSKRGDDGKTIVFVTDIRSTQPISGVEVELYDYQQQLLSKATTSGEGMATFSSKGIPFVVVAKSGNQRGYLKLNDGEALSVSSFEVDGESVQKGLKGFLYGDRGVWRPGDSLHLAFILEDKGRQFPNNHPVVFELQNPLGQVVNRIVRSSSENGFYSFATATAPDAPTGNWTGRVKAGGLTYSQTLKVETIKPNRLKINLDFGTDRFTTPEVTGRLGVKWLHGAVGKNLKAEFEMLLATVPTTFQKYKAYSFEDLSRTFYAESQPVFEGFTNAEGNATMNLNLETGTPPPGFLQVVLRGKVFEESGNFSIDRVSIPYSPYSSYIGMKTPEGEKYSGVLYFDQKHPIDIVTCDADGNPVSRNNIEVNLFKLDWRWWWDNAYSGIANYVNGSYSRLVKKGTVSTANGKGTYTLEMKATETEYGRYYIRACDPVSGHCSGRIIYIDEPGWYSRMKTGENGAPNILTFSAEKTNYKVGEKVKLSIPTPAQGRALISIENGTRMLQSHWIETQSGETLFTFDATTEMTPNIYVSVSLLQPHAQSLNELPVRLYGISGIIVEDPDSRLEPVIVMPDELEPGKEVTIRVSEKTKRKMTYTIAVVDEGLLDITRFKTPDPWNKFYAKEALGVRTWDIFDHVIGAFGSRLERVLTIGGDSELSANEEDPRANRFKPVVKFFGPFTYDGSAKTHRFIMPQYIGSVKTMVVAGYEGAYGKSEKATPVRKPLMVLATLPRVLGPEEALRLPVTLFTADKSIRNVKVTVKTTGPLQVNGEKTKIVSVSPSGDITLDFSLSVSSETGIAKVEVNAESGNFSASDVIEIEVRNPNLPATTITESLLEAGNTWQTEVLPFGVSGTNTALIEVSNLPPVNLGSRLRFLIQYPYGCVEQTTSAVFPQLYLDQIKVLTEIEKVNIQRNVTAGIEKLKSFLLRDGGFGYWPGAEQSDVWGSSYAGHFLVEASAKGYHVPEDIISRWKKFQKNSAEEWRRNRGYANSDLQQAYRLYTLALSGSPAIGAMNRLREESGLSTSAAWMLAAAYAKISQPEAAKKMVNGRDTRIAAYRELGYSYGSALRDKALILETLVLLNEKAKAFEVLKEISQTLSNPNEWLSTQETAMCLKAIAGFAGLEKRGELTFSYTVNGKTERVVSQLPVAQIPVPVTDRKNLDIALKNTGSGILYGRVILEGTPAKGHEEDGENNLGIQIRYTDARGVPIDVTRLEQGTAFVAEVTVRHNGIRSPYENLALAQVFPSGWEISNLRLNDDEQLLKTDAFDYQDIRDDRVYTYFSLPYNASRTFRVMLTASFAGSYYLPAVSCEAMYDKSIYARKKGYGVEVVKPDTQ